MGRIGLLIFLVAVASTGCSGIQTGKFGVSATGHIPLKNVAGELIRIEGDRLKKGHEPTGPIFPLMYVLIICPGVESKGSSGRSDHDGYMSKIGFRIWPATEEVRVEIEWNRKTDVVEIEGAEYTRADGNVFVVIKEIGGTASIWQLESLDTMPSDKDVIEHIRGQLPDNEHVAKLEI